MPPRGYVGVPAGRYCLLLARAYIIILYVGGVKLGVELNVKVGVTEGVRLEVYLGVKGWGRLFFLEMWGVPGVSEGCFRVLLMSYLCVFWHVNS